MRIIVTTVVVVLLLAGLVAWILTHRPGSASAKAVGVDYARVVNHSHQQPVAQTEGHAASGPAQTPSGLLHGHGAA